MRVVLLVAVVLLLVTWENKVNSYSDQLKLGQVCKFGVEFDNIRRVGPFLLADVRCGFLFFLFL